jgi:hypothetical protein
MENSIFLAQNGKFDFFGAKWKIRFFWSQKYFGKIFKSLALISNIFFKIFIYICEENFLGNGFAKFQIFWLHFKKINLPLFFKKN